ncbi:class I SAM-dependent methyltransferase [Mycobacteroides abscessus]|uniref:class I SAM-dependent methyltransferase n=1 Tax=Mycobacteroides abscessus TaxID=36809 RepID=UPI000C258518|nr:class I SAM-dependent methyltransferase [Mycobacteroides abscessus]RIR86329.1 methyltransferase domain-containing protein [Mycobacteroides abscessus]RIT73540.1 methyltransferase domain-containing protein [Mycobacteroides abscessus]
MGAPAQNIFEDLYRESVHEGGPVVPWDSKDAKPRIKELALLGAIRGDVLDIGCGLGDNAIYLAQQGFNVTGLDFAPSAIEQAKVRARWYIWCFAQGAVHGVPTPFQNGQRAEEIEQVLTTSGWSVLQINPTTMSAPKAEFLNAIRGSYRGDPAVLDRLDQDVTDPLLHVPVYTVIAERM